MSAQKVERAPLTEEGEEESIAEVESEEKQLEQFIVRSKTKQLKSIEEGRRIGVNIAFPQKLLDRIIESADQADIPRSELVCDAIRAYLSGTTPQKLTELQTLAETRLQRLKELESAAEKFQAREAALWHNLVILRALDSNEYSSAYACEGLGESWLKLKPIHPQVLEEMKQVLSERNGKYGNDYAAFLDFASKAEGIEPEQLRDAIDKAIDDYVLLNKVEAPKKKNT